MRFGLMIIGLALILGSRPLAGLVFGVPTTSITYEEDKLTGQREPVYTQAEQDRLSRSTSRMQTEEDILNDRINKNYYIILTGRFFGIILLLIGLLYGRISRAFEEWRRKN